MIRTPVRPWAATIEMKDPIALAASRKHGTNSSPLPDHGSAIGPPSSHGDDFTLSFEPSRPSDNFMIA